MKTKYRTSPGIALFSSRRLHTCFLENLSKQLSSIIYEKCRIWGLAVYRERLHYGKKILERSKIKLQDYPPMAGHIRGTTFLSGYLIRENGKGCDLTYVTHTDPGGERAGEDEVSS